MALGSRTEVSIRSYFSGVDKPRKIMELLITLWSLYAVVKGMQDTQMIMTEKTKLDTQKLWNKRLVAQNIVLWREHIFLSPCDICLFLALVLKISGSVPPPATNGVRGSITHSFYRIGGQRVLQLGRDRTFLSGLVPQRTSGGFNTITQPAPCFLTRRAIIYALVIVRYQTLP